MTDYLWRFFKSISCQDFYFNQEAATFLGKAMQVGWGNWQIQS